MGDATNKAVFLSYASQDAAVARNICEALRAAGVEVWFDQSELRGGDAWDAKIRKQIKECALFVPIISANTQARREGYFRIEWKLAAQRTHAIAEGTPFLLPILLGEVTETHALVPSEFREVQWTRVPGAVIPEAFCIQVRALVSGVVSHPGPETTAPARSAEKTQRVKRGRPIRFSAALVAALGMSVAVFLLVTSRGPKTDLPSGKAPWPVGSGGQSESQKLSAYMASIWAKHGDATDDELRLAEELGAQWVSREPTNADAWAAYALATLENGLGQMVTSDQYPNALSRAQRAVALLPMGYDSRIALANVFRVRDATRDDGERLLRQLVAERSGEARALLLLAWTLRAQGKYAEALQYADRAIAAAPDDPHGWLARSDILIDTGKIEDAAIAAEKAVALRAGARELMQRSFIQVFVRDDYQAAAETIEQLPGAILIREAEVWAYAWFWLNHRKPDKAMERFRAFPGDFIRGDPKGFGVGRAFEMLGRPDAAKVEWGAALRLVEAKLAKQPNDATLLYWQAQLLASLGEKDSAERLLPAVRQLEMPLSDLRIPSLLARLGRRDEAIAELEERWERLGLRPALFARTVILHEAIFDPLRDDSRFQAFVARIRADPRFPLPAPPADPTVAPAAAQPHPKSIAVLAFDNLSDDKANEYFSDGISEELINILGRVPGLTVKGRTSAFFFKGNTKVSSAEIAQQLGVAYLVRGSVRKSGNKVRITAQLTRAANDDLIWSSQPITKEVADAFTAQEEIAGLVAQSLQLKLGIQATPTGATSAEALRLYLEGRQIWNLRTRQALDRAEALFNQALALDPKFARARVGRADVWMQRYAEFSAPGENLARFANRRSPLGAKITAEAEAALTEDPTLAEAHTTIGNALMLTWQDAAAEEHFRRALSLNPNYATTHHWLGRLLLREGRMDEARTELAKAADLDPLSPIILDNYGMVLLCAGDAAAALPVIERALLFRPDSVQTLSWQAWALADLGRIDDAVAVARRLAQNPNAAFATPRTFLRAGMKEEAEAFIRRPDLATDELRWFAQLGIGRPAAALTYLQPEAVKSVEIHYLLFLPEFDPVRNDPRFQHVLKALGVVEAHARAQAWRAAHPPTKPALKP